MTVNGVSNTIPEFSPTLPLCGLLSDEEPVYKARISNHLAIRSHRQSSRIEPDHYPEMKSVTLVSNFGRVISTRGLFSYSIELSTKVQINAPAILTTK